MDLNVLNNLLSPIANVIAIAIAVVAAFRAIRRPWTEADPDKRHRIFGYILVAAGLLSFALGFAARYYDALGLASAAWVIYLALLTWEFGRRKRPLLRREVLIFVLLFTLTMNLITEARIASVVSQPRELRSQIEGVASPPEEVTKPSPSMSSPAVSLPEAITSASSLNMAYGEFAKKSEVQSNENRSRFIKQHEGEAVDWRVKFEGKRFTEHAVWIDFSATDDDVPWGATYYSVTSGVCFAGTEPVAVRLKSGEVIRIRGVLSSSYLTSVVIIERSDAAQP